MQAVKSLCVYVIIAQLIKTIIVVKCQRNTIQLFVYVSQLIKHNINQIEIAIIQLKLYVITVQLINDRHYPNELIIYNIKYIIQYYYQYINSIYHMQIFICVLLWYVLQLIIYITNKIKTNKIQCKICVNIIKLISNKLFTKQLNINIIKYKKHLFLINEFITGI